MSYIPKSSATSGVWVLINTFPVTNVAALDIPLGGSYGLYVVRLENIIPASASQLAMRFSEDGGTTFFSGASDYNWNLNGMDTVVSYIDGQVNFNKIVLTRSFAPTMGVGAKQNLNGSIYIHNAKQITKDVCISADINYYNSASVITGHRVGGVLKAPLVTGVDTAQLLTDTGTNLFSGTVTLYGVKEI